jgi:hypothetical protein
VDRQEARDLMSAPRTSGCQPCSRTAQAARHEAESWAVRKKPWMADWRDAQTVVIKVHLTIVL